MGKCLLSAAGLFDVSPPESFFFFMWFHRGGMRLMKNKSATVQTTLDTGAAPPASSISLPWLPACFGHCSSCGFLERKIDILLKEEKKQEQRGEEGKGGERPRGEERSTHCTNVTQIWLTSIWQNKETKFKVTKKTIILSKWWKNNRTDNCDLHLHKKKFRNLDETRLDIKILPSSGQLLNFRNRLVQKANK